MKTLSVKILLFSMCLGWFLWPTPSVSAGLVLSFRSNDLQVVSTGGVVSKNIDLMLTYNGSGNNLISGYDIKISVPAPSVTLLAQPVTNSDLQWSAHELLDGGAGDYLLVGSNNGVDNSLLANVPYRLATLNFGVNTANVPSSFPIQLSVESAVRGGGAGIDIVSDFSYQPASIVVNPVPEPSSCLLVLLTGSAVVVRRTMRGKRTGCHP